MQAVVEICGAEIMVEEARNYRGEFTVSVYPVKDGVADHSDELYSESARTIQDAFSAFQKITAALKRGEFPWEIKDGEELCSDE